MSVTSTRPPGPTRALSQRGTDGPAGADLEAAPSRADAQGTEVAERGGVEQVAQGGEALLGLGHLVVEEVAASCRVVTTMNYVDVAGSGSAAWPT
jgi:hypothetical protein